MENISHSIPNRRSFTSYSNAPHNSVYDHSFGAPPKVGIPTLAPRFEDYAEIFGGFHAYRSSSIPVLHLPSLASDSELHFQVRSSDFDYTEVFGGFRGFGSAASYEDLLRQSGGRYDSSDDPWSPVQSESLSDKVDPLLASDKNYRLPDGDGHQSLESIKQFNIYYNKSSERTMESVLNGHVTNLVAAPGYTYLSNDMSVPPNEKDELCSMPVTDGINCSKDFSERVAEEKQYDKSLSTPSYSGFATRVYDFNPSEKHGYSSFTLDKPFMTISDISLRTKPSQLPPPSRPPPTLDAKNGACDRSNSIFGASKSYAFERVLDGTSPYFFDVEVDLTSSAQGVENGNKSFRVKQSGTEKLNEKKNIQAHSKLHLENATKMKDKTNKTFSLSSTLRGEKMQQSHKIETIGSVPFIEESLRARNSAEPISESQGGKYPNHFAKNSMGTVAWREAKEYFEVMETKNSKEAFEKVEGGDTLKQSTSLDAYKHQGTVEPEQFHQKQDSMKIKAIKEAPIWDEDRNPLEMTAEDCDDCGNEHGRIKANNKFSDKKELQEKLILNKLTCIYNLNEMIPVTFQQPGEKLWMDHVVIVEKHEKALCHEVEAKWKLEAASDQMETEKGFICAHSRKEKNGNHKENILMPEYLRRPGEAVVQAETRKRVKERIELEENDAQQRKGREKENVTKLNETHEQKENEMRVKQAVERRDCGKEIFTDVVHAKIMVNEQLHCNLEKDKEAGKQEATEMRFGNCSEHARDDKKQKEFHDCELMKDRSGDSLEREINDVGMLKAETKVGNKGDPFEREIELPLYGDASTQEELRGQSDEIELIQKNGHLKQVNLNLESHVLIEGDRLTVFDEASECCDENSTEVAGQHNDPLKMEETEAILSVEGNGKLNDEHESRVHVPEARMDDPLSNEKINRFGKNKVELQDRNSHCVTNHTSDSPSLLEDLKYLNKGDYGNGNTCVMLDKIAPEIVFGHETETMKRISTEDETLGKAGAHFIKKEDIRDSLAFREPVESGNMMEGASPVVSDHNEDALSSSRNASIRKMEIKEKNKNENLAPNDQLLGESLRNEPVLENKSMRKIEEEREREREREREKDRMAVDKEALETHTRLYAEARERAAVGRTTAEVRQRAMSEARERLELASNEARFRAERAAVERATAEARQRAIEKSIAEKAAFDTRERVEKPMSDRFSMLSRSADTRQSSLSTDLHHQSTGISNGLRNLHASAYVGSEGESPQRCKARLQRYQRTAERAANALAEKNMRDLLAQREREERNRVAEALDTEVRRWSSGKDGNLRALLSTLQYILGPDSGWQPVPLTEVITSAAVKKAYRRATLCVHPDKLQQRGATIQQKYICEKVFDLLKEAWNKFNSEER